jgi:hypothetical protein
MAEIKFKKSADFSLTVGYTPATGGVPNLLGYTPTCSLEDGAGFVRTLACDMAEDGMSVLVTATKVETNEWKCGSASLDLRLTNGTSVLTDTLIFPIIKNITPLPA